MIQIQREPGAATEGLMAFIATIPQGCTVLEVGSYAGEAALLFLQRAKRVICVDPWESYAAARGNAKHFMCSGAEVEAAFDRRTARFEDRIVKCKMRSTTAALFFQERSIDVVYLDGQHDLMHLVSDIGCWERKVKLDGWLAGHDYGRDCYPDVKMAVDIAFKKPDAVFADTTWAVKGARCGVVQGSGSGR